MFLNIAVSANLDLHVCKFLLMCKIGHVYTKSNLLNLSISEIRSFDFMLFQHGTLCKPVVIQYFKTYGILNLAYPLYSHLDNLT